MYVYMYVCMYVCMYIIIYICNYAYVNAQTHHTFKHITCSELPYDLYCSFCFVDPSGLCTIEVHNHHAKEHCDPATPKTDTE